MLQKIFGYKVELVEHSPEYTVVRSDSPVNVGTQIPVRVSGANGRRTPAVPMVVISCRPSDCGGYLVTGRFLVEHPDLTGFALPPSIDYDSSLRADPRVNCHLCVISRDLPGYRVMTIDLSEGGLQVEAPSRVALGNPVLLRIEFDTEQLPPVQAAATVAWCQNLDRGRYRIGLKFNNLDERSAEVIGLYRRLVARRAATDITQRTVRDEVVMEESMVGESMPTLSVLQWNNIPIFENATLVGYRRTADFLQVRLQGGISGVRQRDYLFGSMRSMRDCLQGDPMARTISEFRFAEVSDGYFRFELLDIDKVKLLEIEAKTCGEQATEKN